MSRLDEIKARCEKAREGPWTYEHDDHGNWENSGVVGPMVRTARGHETPIVCNTDFADDGSFIAHSRSDVPYLVARVERLEAALRGIVARQDRWNNEPDQLGVECVVDIGEIAESTLEASE